MSYNIVTTPAFANEFKKLSKKYRSLPTDLKEVVGLLKEDPKSGESIGNNCYKIRMKISSKNKGKSGGARVITYVKFVDEQIFLIGLYDKSTMSSMAEAELLSRLKNIR